MERITSVMSGNSQIRASRVKRGRRASKAPFVGRDGLLDQDRKTCVMLWIQIERDTLDKDTKHVSHVRLYNQMEIRHLFSSK